MPLPSAHPIGTVPDYGTIQTSLDGALTHASDSLRIAGDRVNQMSADIIEAYAALSAERTVAAKTATYPLVAADHNKLFTNEGASGAASGRPFNLHDAAAGFRAGFYDQDGDGVRIVAAAGDTIRIGTLVSSTAGYIEIAQAGALIFLRKINASEWVAEPTLDAWTVS